MVIDFHKFYENVPYNVALNTFNVTRDSYANRLGTFYSKDGTSDKGICDYINYFIKYYDEDQELLLAYLKIKFILDNKKSNKIIKPKKFNNFIQRYFYTDSLIEKINRLTEANYIVNLAQDTNDKREYPKSLQFTNEHGRIMMTISFMMKIVAPVS